MDGYGDDGAADDDELAPLCNEPTNKQNTFARNYQEPTAHQTVPQTDVPFLAWTGAVPPRKTSQPASTWLETRSQPVVDTHVEKIHPIDACVP